MQNLNIKQLMIPSNRYWLKSPFTMQPKGITIHNTANSVSAIREASFSAGNDWEVSSHYYVDESEAIQSLPLNRIAWHASDGSEGFGNRNTICIEICRSTGDLEQFKQAELNSVKLTLMLMKEFNIPLSMVKRHYDYARDKKYCPHKTMDLGWQRWLNFIPSIDSIKVDKTADFIERIKLGAISGWKTHEILPSLTIAQAILESASGTSELATRANAIFGIKAHTDPKWPKTYEKDTQEWVNGKLVTVKAKFKAYNSWDESIRDRLKYLVTRNISGKYIYADVVGEKDYKKAAQKIYKAGYATDLQYPFKLIKIIEQYNLQKYDNIAISEENNMKTNRIVIGYQNDGDLANALALLNVLGNRALLIKGTDLTEIKAPEIIQVGGTEIKGATKIIKGATRKETLLEISKHLKEK
ncbi:glucosaminidase domain-containing protein [Microaceticoccus formicicus]|uniref:glucosaminidase domain-containing protein n=1 Tax=Microaceticoccus formicicus TaxID=3118105 RepID=UPI003CD00C5C|nr:glucosaminidase domain-containing protein [Peptoniphilaceae bacterium AMB_02]